MHTTTLLLEITVYLIYVVVAVTFGLLIFVSVLMCLSIISYFILNFIHFDI